MRPLIGITGFVEADPTGRHPEPVPRLKVNLRYVEAVERAGGFPVVLPYVPPEEAAAWLARLNGLVLTGGGDISPAAYGEPNRHARGVDPRRDASELALVRAAAGARVPVLGICRGHQLMNVAFGGSLIQDIPSETRDTVDHSPRLSRDARVHGVRLEADSVLAAAIGAEHRVNSLHHQAVGRVGPDLRVTGRAEDGVVEALELPGHPFFVGVQWHPEELGDDPAGLGVFHLLVEAARALA